MFVLYASRLMKGHEVRKKCAEFRDQEGRIKRLQMRIANKKKPVAATTAN